MNLNFKLLMLKSALSKFYNMFIFNTKGMQKQNIFFTFFVVLNVLFLLTACDPYGLKPRGTGLISDIDGNKYDSVILGDQIWMVQNLRVTHYRNGDKITMQTKSEKWSSHDVGHWCNYNNKSSNSFTYGRLYNMAAVNDSRGLAPEGWRVASFEDWKKLKDYLIKSGYNFNAGDTISNKIGISLAAKSSWDEFKGEGLIGNDLASNNKSGFSALPGGGRDETGFFGGIKRAGIWWTSTGVYYFSLSFDSDSLKMKDESGTAGFSVRCVKDVLK